MLLLSNRAAGHKVQPASFTSLCGCRVISPRCVWYTGHVTAGGSVCIEALTQSGSQGSWSPEYNVESMLTVVINNMLHCESYYVRVSLARFPADAQCIQKLWPGLSYLHAPLSTHAQIFANALGPWHFRNPRQPCSFGNSLLQALSAGRADYSNCQLLLCCSPSCVPEICQSTSMKSVPEA